MTAGSSRGAVLIRVHRALRQTAFFPASAKDLPVAPGDLLPERLAVVKDERRGRVSRFWRRLETGDWRAAS
eukprot:1346689-Alexandrium_andersonii.AAC.1